MTVEEFLEQFEKVSKESKVYICIGSERYEVEWLDTDSESEVNICATGR